MASRWGSGGSIDLARAKTRSREDVNYDPDIAEEYRDAARGRALVRAPEDLDPGYRIRELTEQELTEEIQEKYQRALAAAPELMPWAAGLLCSKDQSPSKILDFMRV